jgi:integrase
MGSIWRRGKQSGIPRGPWYFSYVDRRGKQHSESARQGGRRGSYEDARALLAEREGQIVEGVPITPDSVKFSFTDGAQLVVNDYAKKERRSTSDLQRRLDKHLTPYFGAFRLSEITTDVIDAFVAARKKAGASNGEINRELAIVKRMYSLAMKARKIHHRPHIEMLAEAPPRAGFFEFADFERVRRRLPKEIRPLASFCYITGWRWKSEVARLRWQQVDFAAGTVSIDAGRTKGGEPRVFVMTPELRTLLKGQRTYTQTINATATTPCLLVFHRAGKPIRDFYDSWRSACTAAEVPGRLIHDFRRTAIRNLVRAGVSEVVAMKMCGHKTRAVFDRYNVSSLADFRDAAERLSAHHKGLARHARTAEVLHSRKRTTPRQRRKA